MARLIGIPDDLVPTCREISDLHMRRISQRGPLVPMRMSDELFGPLLKARRAAPADDLLSGLVAAEVDGRRLTHEELLGFCYLLLIGGNDTTSNWIGNAAVLLAQRPDVRAEIVADRSLLPTALEEVMRLESPTQVLPRRATRAVTLHGTTVAAGTCCVSWCGVRRIATSASSSMPSGSTSTETTRATSRSGRASTSAWAPRWHDSSARRIRSAARPQARLRARGHAGARPFELGPRLRARPNHEADRMRPIA